MRHHPTWSAEEVQDLLAAGRADAALRCVEGALATEPDNGQALFLKARALLNLGRAEEAHACGELLAPWLGEFSGWHWVMAEIFLALQRPSAALPHALQGLALDPDDSALWVARSRAELQQQLNDAASTSAERAVALRPEDPATWMQSAAAAAAAGHLAAAEKALRQVLALRPEDTASCVGLALLFCDQNRAQEAESLLAPIAPPDGPAAAIVWDARARAFLKNAKPAEALDAAKRALALCPASAEYALYHAMALDACHETDAAQAALQAARTRHPASAELWNLQGAWQARSGDFTAARSSFQRAIQAAPSTAAAHVNLGIEHLRAGEWGDGWREYRWRWKVPGFWNDALQRPRWQGERLDGTLLVLTEQGAGDTVQFLRFLPQVRPLVQRIVLAAPDNLRRWCLALAEVDAVLGEQEPFPEHAAYIALMDLPGALAESGQHPAVPPPFPTRPELLRRSRKPSTLCAGMVWAGNPKHTNDRNRSLRPEDMAQLQHHCASICGLEWVCFQRGYAPGATLPGGIRGITGLANGDMEQTARELAAEVDVLVTVDTALVHLAGTLGVPTLLLVPHVADWRWGIAQTTSVWYPGVQIVRQDKAGSWASAIEAVHTVLARQDAPTSTAFCRI